MSTTRYLEEQMGRKRPYLTASMCRHVIAAPISRVPQDDGCIRYWGRVSLPGEAEARILGVVTLEDDETIHNAFLDRGYREDLR